MKKLIITFVCIGGILNAQERTYTEKMDSLMQYVDKSQMTTPILYDRVFSFTKLDKKIPNNVDYNYFIQAWSELHRASNNPNFISADELKAMAKESQKNNRIQLGVIHLKYNYIDYGTPQSPNLVFENGFFRNVAGKNPFREKEITMVVPLVDKITSPQVQFVLDKNGIAQTHNVTPIQAIQVDFGNGQMQTISLTQNSTLANGNSRFSTQYATNGTKNLTFKITYADGVQKTISQKMEVQAPELSLAVNRTQNNNREDFTGAKGINSTIPFQGYNEPAARFGKLEYSIYYHNSNKELHKPIIVLDGYDPGDKRKTNPSSADYKEEDSSVYEQMEYDHDKNANTPNKNLVTVLQNEGFDVVLVNFPNGADFIERNAMAVIELIKRLNITLQQNGSTEQLTLIGPSMGGLISRYALAYMEKHNMPHNTKLWVSFDSPHHGANIPISLQRNLYFFGFVGGKEVARDKWIENFNSPATRQMLIEQMDAYPYPTHTGSTHNMNNQHPFRQQFLQNLTNNGVAGSNGFPTQTRNIAITNGTTNGQKINSEGQTLLELAAFGPLRYKAVVSVNNALPHPFQSHLNFEGKMTSAGFLSISVNEIKITHGNNNSRGSMDVVQGGTFNTQGIIKDKFHPELKKENLKDIQWRQYNPNHSFIPTVSSLAFKNPEFDWNSNISRNLLCGQEIPFHSYFVPKTNEEHVYISNDMVEWLMQEIKGNPQGPHLNLSNVELSSSKKVLCINEETVVSLNNTSSCNLPGDFTWSVSSNFQIVNNSNDNVTVKAIGEGVGYVYMNFANGQKITKKIWVGKPQVDYELTHQGIRMKYNLVSKVPEASLEDQGIINTSCKINYANGYRGNVKNCQSGVYRGDTCNWLVIKETKVANSCGEYTFSTAIESRLEDDLCNLCDDYTISWVRDNTYRFIDDCPYNEHNPRNDNPQVRNKNSRNASTLNNRNSHHTIELANAMGQTVLTTSQDTFDISHLPAGAYYARVMKNGQVVHTQVLRKQ